MGEMTFHRREPRPGYTQIPNCTLRYRFGDIGANGLLCYLLSNADGWKTNERSIAEALGVSRSPVTRLMGILTDHGFVSRRQVNEGGEFGSTEYWVTDDPDVAVRHRGTIQGHGESGHGTVPMTRHGAVPDSGHGTVPYKNINEKTNEEEQNPLFAAQTDSVVPSASSTQYSESFNAFWNDYRQSIRTTEGQAGNKKPAAMSWAKLSPSDRRDAHRRLPLYFAATRWPQNCVTYLNQRGWDNFDDGDSIADVAPSALTARDQANQKFAETVNRDKELSDMFWANQNDHEPEQLTAQRLEIEQ